MLWFFVLVAVVMAPKNLQSTVVTISDIHMNWDKVKHATSYEIIMIPPTGDVISQYTNANDRQFLFRKLVNDTSYRFKVRARSTGGYGNFSKEVVVKTLKLSK